MNRHSVAQDYEPAPSLTPEQLAAKFGRKVLISLAEDVPVDVIERQARMAGSFARIALERQQEERNAAHRAEVARGWAVIHGVCQAIQQHTRQTDAHLGGVEEN